MSRVAWPAACCSGAGPMSFLTLADLEDYEIGLSTSFRDVYGWYNPYGELEEADRFQTYTLTVSATKRIWGDLSAFASLPWVMQFDGSGPLGTQRQSLGDAVVGAQYVVLRSVYHDDWYPTVTLIGGMKMPSGTMESWGSQDQYLPGTGNGLWEPFFGVGLLKTLGPWRLNFTGTYAHRFERSDYAEGDRVDLVETLTYVLGRRLALAAGADQTWILATPNPDGTTIPDSQSRAVDFFLSPTYFLNPYFAITAGMTVTVPFQGTGVNHQAARAFALSTRYGFY